MVESPRLVLYPLQGLQLWLSERAGQQLLIFPGGHGPGAGPGDPQGFGLGQAQQGSWEETKRWPEAAEPNSWPPRNNAEPSSWSQTSNYSNNWQTPQPSASTAYHGTNKAATTSTFYQGPHSVYHGNTRTYFSPEQGVWCPTSTTSTLNRHLAPAGSGGCTCNCRFGPRHNQQEVMKT